MLFFERQKGWHGETCWMLEGTSAYELTGKIEPQRKGKYQRPENERVGRNG